jgi:hypothetical protein
MKKKYEVTVNLDGLSVDAKHELYAILEKHEMPSRLYRYWGWWAWSAFAWKQDSYMWPEVFDEMTFSKRNDDKEVK